MSGAEIIAEPARRTDQRGIDQGRIDQRSVDRRTLIRGAAWSVPVVALAVATPAAAASDVELGAYSLMGTCGIPAQLGPGFLLTAGPGGIPVGTTITVVGAGIANIGVFSTSGGTANVAVLSGSSRLITITGAVAPGAVIAFRTTLSTSIVWTLNATTVVPTGYVATGAKTSAQVTSTQVLCSAT